MFKFGFFSLSFPFSSLLVVSFQPLAKLFNFNSSKMLNFIKSTKFKLKFTQVHTGILYLYDKPSKRMKDDYIQNSLHLHRALTICLSESQASLVREVPYSYYPYFSPPELILVPVNLACCQFYRNNPCCLVVYSCIGQCLKLRNHVLRYFLFAS